LQDWEIAVQLMHAMGYPAQYRDAGEALHLERFPRANGLGTFMLTGYVPTTERTSERYPLLLTTGRILSQYNAGTQTRRTANSQWHPEDVLEISAADASARCIRDGERLQISSRLLGAAYARGAAGAHRLRCPGPGAPSRGRCAPAVTRDGSKLLRPAQGLSGPLNPAARPGVADRTSAAAAAPTATWPAATAAPPPPSGAA